MQLEQTDQTVSKRPLGDPDAMHDKGFYEHFVISNDLAAVLNDQTMLIYGSKGTGKTALRRALTEIHRDRYCATGTIDFDDISFMQVYADLERIHKTTAAEIAIVARAAWRNVLALFVVELVAFSLPQQHPLRQRIGDFLSKHRGLQPTSTHNRLLAWIERIYARIEQCVAEVDSPAQNLSVEQRMVAVAFPGVDGLSELLTAATDHCRARGKVALVCLDGFDSIVDHMPESRSAIFAGLIDALDRNRREDVYAGAVCFKAFLPTELTEEAQLLLWDADKRPTSFTHRLRWSIPEFHAFIAKRLLPYTKTRGSSFRENWEEIFPVTLHNKVHNLEEDVFGYIFRHTLHRPRHMLIQLQRLVDAWDRKHDTVRIDPSFIPSIVARTNEELAEKTVDQLSRRLQNIYSFIHSFRGASCVHAQTEFLQRLRKCFQSYSPQDIELIAKELYDLGLFGIVVPSDGSSASDRRVTRCRFGSIGQRQRGRVLPWEATDSIAISPMFQEFCGLRESEHGPIVPIM